LSQVLRNGKYFGFQTDQKVNSTARDAGVVLKPGIYSFQSTVYSADND